MVAKVMDEPKFISRRKIFPETDPEAKYFHATTCTLSSSLFMYFLMYCLQALINITCVGSWPGGATQYTCMYFVNTVCKTDRS